MTRMNAVDKQYQAQDDLRTLQRAQEIQQDRQRVSAAKKEATKQAKALQQVAGKQSSSRRRGK